MTFFTSIQKFWDSHGWTIIIVGSIVVIFILFLVNSSNGSSTVDGYDIGQIFANSLLQPAPSPPTKQAKSPIKLSRGEAHTHDILHRIFRKPFVKVRPDFLKNPVTGNNLELDHFNEEMRLAVEYNGEQHYNMNGFMHKNNKDRFHNQKYRDYIKKDFCEKNGITLIVVPYSIPLDEIENFIIQEIRQHRPDLVIYT